jgi:catechol 2,3-dioxygenase-like lactoylglutathione lyase family enzyme
MIQRLDHVNLRSANVERLVRFYAQVLELRRGERPPLGFPGAWLYAGERAVVHIVEVESTPAPAGELRLEHFAFLGSGLSRFLARLDRLAVDYHTSTQPGTGNVLVNLRDPDGNHFHVDFVPE